jgi:hypothetical protein
MCWFYSFDQAKQTISPQAPKYDIDVKIRSILEYEQFIPEVALLVTSGNGSY